MTSKTSPQSSGKTPRSSGPARSGGADASRTALTVLVPGVDIAAHPLALILEAEGARFSYLATKPPWTAEALLVHRADLVIVSLEDLTGVDISRLIPLLAEETAVVVWMDIYDHETAINATRLGAQEVLIDGALPIEAMAERLIFASERAIRVREREREVQAKAVLSRSLEALNRLPMATVLLEPDGRVRFLNQKAADLINTTAAISLGPEKHVRLTDGMAEKKLYAMIRELSDGTQVDNDASLVLTIEGAGRSKSVTMLLAPVGSRQRGQGAVLFMAKTGQNVAVSKRVLQDLYQLTPAESEVVVGLAQGLTIQEVAEKSGTTQNTVRSQMKQIFQKTETNRQPELVKLVLTGPAVLLSGVDSG